MMTLSTLQGRNGTVVASPGDGTRPALRATILALVMAAILTFLVPPISALAQDTAPDETAVPLLGAGDLLVRARISGILPYDLRSQIDIIGGTIEVPNMVLPDVDVSYLLTDHIAITGQTGALKTRFKIRDSLYGDIDVGSIWTLPVALSIDYHVLPNARFNPYLGLGAVATWFKGAKPASPLVKDFSVDRQISPMIRVGLDVHMTGNWFANTEVKLVLPPTQVLTNSGVTARTDVKSLSVGFGVGYRF